MLCTNPSDLLLARPAPALYLAPWHAARPHLICSTLAEARRLAPHLTTLADQLLPRLPRRVLASRSIRSVGAMPTSGPVLLDAAVAMPWLAVNSPEGINAICLDVDHADGPDLVADLAARGCPAPTLVVDPWSGRAHAVLPLATPVLTTDGARLGPQILGDLAARLLARALRATLLPQVALVKNPWGLAQALDGARLLRGVPPTVVAAWEQEEADKKAAQQAEGSGAPMLWEAYQASGSPLMWHTLQGSEPAELRAVIAALADDYVEEVSPRVRKRFRYRGEPSSLGRNCALFDLTRWWAYDCKEHDPAAILSEAERINRSFSEPLPQAEVRATARSIARFMARRYQPRARPAGSRTPTTRGRDQAEGAHLDKRGRQALAGRVTAAVRASKSDERLATAVASLTAQGLPLSQAAVLAASGLSLRTIKSRWHQMPKPKVQDAVALSGSAPPRALPPQAALPGNPIPSPVSLALAPDESRPLLSSSARPGPACPFRAPPPTRAPLRRLPRYQPPQPVVRSCTTQSAWIAQPAPSDLVLDSLPQHRRPSYADHNSPALRQRGNRCTDSPRGAG